MRLLAWNICHGGGARLPRIVEEIAAHDPDLIALTEYRAGKDIRAALADRGWPYVETTDPRPHENGIAIFSNSPLRRLPSPAAPEHQVRWLDVALPAFTLSVLHIMAAGSTKSHPLNIEKRRFWDTLLQAAQARLQTPALMLGDWNTGAHRLDETGKTYVCADHFLQLSALGWTDLWRRHNPHTTEWTWYSNFGNPFRLDHAFATPPLLPRVTACRYSHREREARISDHSITLVDLA
jgi:exodeoxyribonuclease III